MPARPRPDNVVFDFGACEDLEAACGAAAFALGSHLGARAQLAAGMVSTWVGPHRDHFAEVAYPDVESHGDTLQYTLGVQARLAASAAAAAQSRIAYVAKAQDLWDQEAAKERQIDSAVAFGDDTTALTAQRDDLTVQASQLQAAQTGTEYDAYVTPPVPTMLAVTALPPPDTTNVAAGLVAADPDALTGYGAAMNTHSDELVPTVSRLRGAIDAANEARFDRDLFPAVSIRFDAELDTYLAISRSLDSWVATVGNGFRDNAVGLDARHVAVLDPSLLPPVGRHDLYQAMEEASTTGTALRDLLAGHGLDPDSGLDGRTIAAYPDLAAALAPLQRLAGADPLAYAAFFDTLGPDGTKTLFNLGATYLGAERDQLGSDPVTHLVQPLSSAFTTATQSGAIPDIESAVLDVRPDHADLDRYALTLALSTGTASTSFLTRAAPVVLLDPTHAAWSYPLQLLQQATAMLTNTGGGGPRPVLLDHPELAQTETIFLQAAARNPEAAFTILDTYPEIVRSTATVNPSLRANGDPWGLDPSKAYADYGFAFTDKPFNSQRALDDAVAALLRSGLETRPAQLAGGNPIDNANLLDIYRPPTWLMTVEGIYEKVALAAMDQPDQVSVPVLRALAAITAQPFILNGLAAQVAEDLTVPAPVLGGLGPDTQPDLYKLFGADPASLQTVIAGDANLSLQLLRARVAQLTSRPGFPLSDDPMDSDDFSAAFASMKWLLSAQDAAIGDLRGDQEEQMQFVNDVFDAVAGNIESAVPGGDVAHFLTSQLIDNTVKDALLPGGGTLPSHNENVDSISADLIHQFGRVFYDDPAMREALARTASFPLPQPYTYEDWIKDSEIYGQLRAVFDRFALVPRSN